MVEKSIYWLTLIKSEKEMYWLINTVPQCPQYTLKGITGDTEDLDDYNGAEVIRYYVNQGCEYIRNQVLLVP